MRTLTNEEIKRLKHEILCFNCQYRWSVGLMSTCHVCPLCGGPMKFCIDRTWLDGELMEQVTVQAALDLEKRRKEGAGEE